MRANFLGKGCTSIVMFIFCLQAYWWVPFYWHCAFVRAMQWRVNLRICKRMPSGSCARGLFATRLKVKKVLGITKGSVRK
jgi:hypothetical protein